MIGMVIAEENVGCKKYHVVVIVYLLGFRVANMDLKGAKECIRVICQVSDNKLYNYMIVLKAIIRGLIQRVD